MKTKLTKMLAELEIMRDQAQERIDNAGDSDSAQDRASKLETIVEYLESAIGEIESAIAELE